TGRAENGADVAVLGRCARMRLKWPGRQRILPRPARPPPDVDDVEKPAFGARKKQRVHAFSQAEKALNPRQRLRVRHYYRRRRNAWTNRIGVGAKQEYTSRDGAVLVAGERSHT